MRRWPPTGKPPRHCRDSNKDTRMKVSASIELVMQLAGQEAIAGKFKEIQPEHLCMALLKLSELPVVDVDRIASGSSAAKELAAEVAAVREALQGRSIDTTRTRRQLRDRLGSGGSPYDGGPMHRSPPSRQLFDAADRLADDARSDALAARHLLEALLAEPTAAIAKVLGEAAGARPEPARITKTPLLDEHGRDLTQLAAAGQLACPPGREAESKSVAHLLAQPNCCCVLLVGCDKDVMESVAATLAHMAIAGTPKGLRAKRIIDVGAVQPQGSNANETTRLLDAVLAEAASVPDVIVLVPPIETVKTPASLDAWPARLKMALARGRIQCLCRVSEHAYQSRMAKDPQWRRIAKAMWVRAERSVELPDEL